MRNGSSSCGGRAAPDTAPARGPRRAGQCCCPHHTRAAERLCVSVCRCVKAGHCKARRIRVEARNLRCSAPHAGSCRHTHCAGPGGIKYAPLSAQYAQWERAFRPGGPPPSWRPIPISEARRRRPLAWPAARLCTSLACPRRSWSHPTRLRHGGPRARGGDVRFLQASASRRADSCAVTATASPSCLPRMRFTAPSHPPQVMPTRRRMVDCASATLQRFNVSELLTIGEPEHAPRSRLPSPHPEQAGVASCSRR